LSRKSGREVIVLNVYYTFRTTLTGVLDLVTNTFRRKRYETTMPEVLAELGGDRLKTRKASHLIS
jgi:hypothetical protein